MKALRRGVGAVALALTIVPAILVAGGSASLETNKTLMLVGTLLWFTTPLLSPKSKRITP